MHAIKTPVSDAAAPRPRHRIVADDKARPRPGGGRSLPIALVYLVAFLLFAGVVWFAWLETMGGRGEPPLVRAAEGPFKRPADTVTGSDADQDVGSTLLLADEHQPPHVERIAPRPATPPKTPLQAEPSLAAPLSAPEAAEPPPAAPSPMPRAVTATPPSGPATAEVPTGARPATPPPGTALPAATGPVTPAATARPPVSVAALPSSVPPAASAVPGGGAPRTLIPAAAPPSATPPTTPYPAAVAPAAGPRQLVPGSSPQPGAAPSTATTPAGPRPLVPSAGPPTAAPPVAVAPPATPPAPRVAAVSGGVWRIQIAALSSRAAVEQAWSRLRGQHPAELGGLSLFVEEVPGAGLYRMQAGGFGDRDTAARVCTVIKAGGSPCFVVGARS